VTYPEEKIEEKEDALRAFQPAADGHRCPKMVAASHRLQTSASPALQKKLKCLTKPIIIMVFVCSRRKTEKSMETVKIM
jgi:hypothetical protein